MLVRPSTLRRKSRSSTAGTAEAGAERAGAERAGAASGGRTAGATPSQCASMAARPSIDIGLLSTSSMPAAVQRDRSSPTTAALSATIGT